MDKKKFYIYTHSKPDGEVFYVGKGTFQRNSTGTPYNRAHSFTRRSSLWNKIKNKYGIVIDICYITEDENECFSVEKAFISFYGRIDLKTGTLVNFTEGGEGSSGYKPTNEQINSNRNAQKKRFLERPETFENFFSASKGRTTSEESRERYRTANLGEKNPSSKLTEDTVRKVREMSGLKIKQKDIALALSITAVQVSRIVNNQRWSHVK